MLRYTAGNVAKALSQRYAPQGFLTQYSEAEGLPVALGEGTIEERGSGLLAVTYPLIIGGQTSSGNLYSIAARGIHLPDPEVAAVTFSGRHPLATGVPLVQLIATREGEYFVRGNDIWLDIKFPGIETRLEREEPRTQPQPQLNRRVAVATRPALSGKAVRDIEQILQLNDF